MNNNSSCQKVKPKKITWVLLSPFILITMACNIISAGIVWLVDKPWYYESKRQIISSHTSKNDPVTSSQLGFEVNEVE